MSLLKTCPVAVPVYSIGYPQLLRRCAASVSQFTVSLHNGRSNFVEPVPVSSNSEPQLPYGIASILSFLPFVCQRVSSSIYFLHSASLATVRVSNISATRADACVYSA